MAASPPQKQLVLSINLNETLSKDIKMENVNGREVVTLLPVLIRRTVGDTKVIVSLEQANHGGFRKIEPKPVGESNAAGVSSFDIKERRKKRKGGTSVRFLGSNATRRGVRICVTCQGRIGYRSKKCKYCLINEKHKPMGNLDTSTKGTMNTNVLQRKLTENTESIPPVVEADEGKENELHVQESENVLRRALSADHNYVQISSYSKNEVLFPMPVFGAPNTLLSTKNKIVDTSQITEDKVKGTGQGELSLCCDDTTPADQSGSLEGQNDDQGQTSPQDGHFDRQTIPQDLCQISVKQEINEDNLCDLDPCSVSENNLINHMFLEDRSISDISLTASEGDEKRAGELVQTGRKRKQKAYPRKKKKQCKDYPVIQFMRIEPKPCLEDETCPKKLDQGKLPGNKPSGKPEPVRFLASNATRRGIMPCPMCQKEVGCRSKSCKHCTVSITLNKYKALNDRNLLLVQLSPQTDPDCAVFSIKKTTTPSEERCFIKQAPVTPTKDCKDKIESSTAPPSTWSCECLENDDFSQIPMCEHAMCFFRNPKIVQARTATLAAQKIDSLPIDNIFKNKLKQLWEKNKRRELPLVQQVGLNTLAILDIEKATGNCSDGGTCVHIRFEKLKRHSIVQHHIFCSGKSCSVWSPLQSQKDSPITCLHYCISLWAIASDNELQEYFKIFLEAPQVFLHSEVFESIVTVPD